MKNYHTHTYRCKHAVGTVEDYVKAAIENDVQVLGMSDHTPFPNDSHWLKVRMAYEELEAYCKEIDEAKEKYKEIKILKGFECEYLKEYHEFYKEVLLGQHEADYLILAGHQIFGTSPWNLRGEVKSLKEIRPPGSTERMSADKAKEPTSLPSRPWNGDPSRSRHRRGRGLPWCCRDQWRGCRRRCPRHGPRGRRWSGPDHPSSELPAWLYAAWRVSAGDG